jgi:hypothetical protein
MLVGIIQERSKFDVSMRSLYDYHQGEYMLVFDKLRNIPFWNADI